MAKIKTFKDLRLWNSLRFKIVIALFLAVFLGTPIADFINDFINSTGLIKGHFGAYIAGAINFVVMSVILLFFLNKLILYPLAKITQILKEVGNGNLAIEVQFSRNDEVGVVFNQISKVIDNIESMISSINNYSERLASYSEEMASSTEEISATIEEISSTTNEVAVTSSKEAENAKMTAEESKQVQKAAQEGNQDVKNTVEKMNSIAHVSDSAGEAVKKLGSQSNQIGEIIDTITNIADQTNLLALNAAIEAARAGEHGKGFAVVAEEVRKLAEQSSESANQITSLIKEIQGGVDEAVAAMKQGSQEINEGVEIANNAGASLEQIRKAVEKNTYMIGNIAKGAEQANERTKQLSESHEQISSTVQQVSGSAQGLANIAEELQNAVQKFKI